MRTVGTPKEIRQAVITALLAHTDADDRVADSQVLPEDMQSLKAGPHLSVWTPAATAPSTDGRRQFKVAQEISIQANLVGPDSATVMDRLDTLDAQCRDVLLSGSWASGWNRIVSWECRKGLHPDQPKVGAMDLTIRVEYDQAYRPAAPEATGNVHHVTTNPGQPTGAPTTEQIISMKEPPARPEGEG